MSKNDLSAKDTMGCALSLWHLLVMSPMWFSLLYGILSSIGESVPMWVWVLYWSYVPAVILGGAMMAIVRAMSVEQK